MSHWKVLIEGRNFWFRTDGGLRRMGFYATRFVEAPDDRAAEYLAVDLIRDDLKKRPGPENERADPPMLYAEEIVEVGVEDVCPATGYTFYAEEDDRVT